MDAETVPLVCRACGPVYGPLANLPRVLFADMRLLACPHCRGVSWPLLLAISPQRQPNPKKISLHLNPLPPLLLNPTFP
jgi:uncharacterized protein YbaR (Trm112 family)